MRHLNQVIGNAVTYSFVHNNKHGDQNLLVPVLGLSGGEGTMTVVMYDCVADTLAYMLPIYGLTVLRPSSAVLGCYSCG